MNVLEISTHFSVNVPIVERSRKSFLMSLIKNALVKLVKSLLILRNVHFMQEQKNQFLTEINKHCSIPFKGGQNGTENKKYMPYM